LGRPFLRFSAIVTVAVAVVIAAVVSEVEEVEEITDGRTVVWVGLKPTERLRASRGRRCRKKKAKDKHSLLGEKKEVCSKRV